MMILQFPYRTNDGIDPTVIFETMYLLAKKKKIS